MGAMTASLPADILDAIRAGKARLARLATYGLGRRASWLVLCGLACTGRDAQRRPLSQTDVRTLVTEIMSERLSPIKGTPFQDDMTAGFPDSVVILSDTSKVVPGLRYHLGAFRPTGVNHGAMLVGAAELGRNIAVVETPRQWALLVARGPWRPQSAGDALGACEEIITHVLRPGHSSKPPIVFRDSTSLSDRVTRVKADRDFILARAHSPIVHHLPSESGWEVDLWAIESEITARYRCRLGGDRSNLDVRVAAIDSLPCSGQWTSCGMSLEQLFRVYGSPRVDPPGDES